MSRIDDFIKKHLGTVSNGQRQTTPMQPTQPAQSTGESSVDDLIKKHLGTAYGSEQQTHATQSSQTSSSAVDDFIRKHYIPVDNNYIYSYITDWDKYAKDAKTAYDGLNWESATSGNLDRFNDTEKDLSSRAAAIRFYVEAHKNDYDEEQYKNLISQLDEMDAFRSNFRNGLTEAQKYYSQWATADDYNSYLEQQKSVPSVVATGPQPQKSRPGRMGIATSDGLAQTAEAIRNGTYQEPAINLSKHKVGWFQKPAALDDGFQIKDIPSIVGGTISDVGGHLVEGVGNLAENALDAVTDTTFSGVNWFMNTITNGEFERTAPIIRQMNAVKRGEGFVPLQSNEELKRAAMDEDVIGAKEIADLYIRDPAQGLLGINVEDSLLGEKSDALVQSAGQLAAQYGLSIVGVPWFVTAGLSSYGAELKNAYAHGATREQAVTSAMIAAGAEILSEYLFAGDLFIGNAGTALATDALGKAISGKALNSFLRRGFDILGEGFEEVFSQFLSRLGSTAYRDENIGQILFSEEALEEYVDSAVGGVALGGAMTGVNILAEHSNSNVQTQAPVNRPLNTSQTSAVEQITENPGSLQSPAITESDLSSAAISPDAVQTPQSAPETENLSGITQGGNAAIPSTAGQEAGADNAESTSKPRISMEDYANQNSPVWRNVEYSDDATKDSIMQQTHDAMIAEGVVVTVPDSVTGNVEQAFPDLRDMKKKERTPILKNAMNKLKSDLRQFLNNFKNQGFEFEVNGKILEATLYNTGINEVMEKITKDKASMLYSTEEIFRNARYLYSTPDYDGDPNVYRWNYFYTPVQIGESTVGVRIAVRDLIKQGESQIYNWGIKKNASLGGVRDDLSNRKPYGASSDASNNSILKTDPGVNPDITSSEDSSQNSQPTTSVGAAPAGFDPLTHAMLEYGNIPEGENAVRDDSLPVSMDGESKVSHVARTVLGAEATPDSFADKIRSEVANGELSYIPITNDATVQKVEKRIQKVGWQEAYTEWVAKVEKGVTGAEMTATGALLLNNAANAGDHKSWRNILYHFQKLGTNTAQGLQAFRILKTLSPSDKLWMVEKSAQQMVEDLGLDVEISLDEALVDEYDSAQTDEQREAALDKIIDSVAEQIPSTFMEKVNSVRYMNMLGNLRTQIRNLTGNISMAGVTSIKNTVATALEHLVHKISGGKIERTKSFTVSREMVQAGKDDFAAVESIVNSGGRYALRDGESTDIAQRIQDKRKIFRSKALAPVEGYRRVINWAMDKGDILFSKPAYARALAGYLKAHGVTDADFSKVDPELMDKARLYAIKQAQEQTFRDTNKISKSISKLARKPDTPAVFRILAEGALPFRKTPANIAVRAWEYSPLGIVNAVVDTVNAARNASYAKSDTKANGKKKAKPKADTTAADAINSWAKTLTGGGLIGLGMLLQSLGLIRGTEDDDEQRAFDSLNGWQEYSLVLPDGTNLTIDALSPAALPLLVGAQMKAVIDGEGFSLDQVLGCMSALADPMVDMSLMSGIKSLIEEIRYSKEPLGQIGVNTLIDYATQIVTNSLVGQLERSTEKQRMQTYVDPDSSTADWLQKTLGGISAKTPGWDYQQIPYINAWGETEETPTGLNLLENTVSPVYFDQGEKTPLTEELNRLYNDAQETGVYPSRPDKKQTYTDKNGVKHKDYGLDAQEYVEFATVQGQTQKRVVEDLIASDAYKSLPDSYKAEAVKKAYYYARETARKQVLSDTAAFAESKWMSEISDSEAEAILSRVHLQYLTDQVIPESGYQKPRQVQIVEHIAATDDGYTESEQEAMLLATLTEAKVKTYEKVKRMGYDIDDFAAVYRIYQKADDSKTYNKEHAIRDIARTLGVSEATATTLYEAYQKPNG